MSNSWIFVLKKYRPVRMKIPLVLIRSKYQRKLPLARELFFSRFARNRTNLFKSFKSFSYLFDLYRFVRFDFVDRWFCPLGHSFFSHHIATYREHHFQSYQVEKFLINSWKFVLKKYSLNSHNNDQCLCGRFAQNGI